MTIGNIMTATKKLVTAKEAAAILGTTEGTLAAWRSTKKVDIPYCKIGKSVKYNIEVLEQFIEANTHGSVQ